MRVHMYVANIDQPTCSACLLRRSVGSHETRWLPIACAFKPCTFQMESLFLRDLTKDVRMGTLISQIFIYIYTHIFVEYLRNSS